MVNTIEVYSITKGTEVNGPGKRYMVHVQGCTLGCKGCFNTITWPTKSETSSSLDIAVLAEDLLDSDIDGITISGGEPLQQPEAVIRLIRILKASGVDVLLYTGYTKAEVDDAGYLGTLTDLVDTIVFGRFEKDKLIPQPHTQLRGSYNQEVFTKTGEDSSEGASMNLEFHIEPGKVEITGFPGRDLIKLTKRELGV